MNQREILTEDDFYTYFKPFAIWLVKKKHKKFETISNKESKKYFKKFVKKWNSNSLKPIFYNIDSLLEKYSHLIQSTHNWNLKLSSKDAKVLDSCLPEIHDLNKFTFESKGHNPEKPEEPKIEKKIKIIGPSFPQELKEQLKTENEKILNEEEARELKKKEIKFIKKKEKRDELEMSPKKMGREAAIEKKRTLNKMLNGEKEVDVEAETYEEDAGSSFQQAKKREAMRKEKRERKIIEKKEIINEKVKKFQESEDLTVRKLLESLGLDKKYKI